QLSADFDSLQLHCEKLQEVERRAVGELERAKAKVGEVELQAGEAGHQSAADINNLRRELQYVL
ncbi:hypothetical protein B484DRAFT_408150, partial [Ochromonadaceae sp. CCMP2298]